MTSATSSGCTTPHSKLDSLSRNDLIRFAKKQVHNFQLAQQRLETLELDTNSTADLNARLKEENERITKSLEDSRLNESKLYDEIQVTKNDLQLKIESNQKVYAAEITKVNGLNEQLSAEKLALDVKMCELLAEVSRLSDERKTHLSQMADIQAELVEKNRKVSDVQEECQVLRTALNDRDRLTELTMEQQKNAQKMTKDGEKNVEMEADGLKLPEQSEQKLEDTEPIEADRRQITILEEKIGEQREQLGILQTELENVRGLLRQQSFVVDQTTAQSEQRRDEIERLRTLADSLKQQLDALKERTSSQNVLNLEMADYEKSVARLEQELVQCRQMIQSKSNESECLKKELDAVRSQKGKTESNMAKLKTAFVKTKRELEKCKVDLESKTVECSDLADKLQQVSAQMENLKMEMSASVCGDRDRLAQLESTVASLHRQLKTVTSQKELLKTQYDDLDQQYKAFKTRAHSVLKQQSKEQQEQEGRSGEGEAERAELARKVAALERRLNDTNGSYVATQDELAAVQEEYDRLNGRFRHHQMESAEKLASLQQKMSAMRSDYEQRLLSESATTDKLQIRQKESDREHAKVVETMKELHEREMKSLRDTIRQMETARASSEITRIEDTANTVSHVPLLMMNGPPVSERGPAEGQEAVIDRVQPMNRLQKRKQGHNGDVQQPSLTLEEIISDDDAISSISTVTSPMDGEGEDYWIKTETALRKRLQHSTELLNETEASNARLTEQTALLKQEIRRLERNSEREQHIANCEYLKNVVMKFLSPEKINDERPQLIPVLTTMLRLGPEEVDTLTRVASDGAGQGNTGWSGYLHRWSGMS